MQRELFKQGRASMRQETALGVAMLVAGLMIAGVAASRMGPERIVQAQISPQAQGTPPDAAKPAEPMPGGTRPTTPAPEPARPPTSGGSTSGAAPASPSTGDRPPVTGTPLPPAPAEQVGPPVQGR